MTGSAVSAVDVGSGKITFRMGGGPEEGGTAVGRDGRPADYGKCFSTNPFFSSGSEVPGGKILD